MAYNKRKVGTIYEQTAGRYLEGKGFQIVAYNYRCRMGEIDIIAKEGQYVVFCEVKYRKNMGAGHPLEAVDVKKQKVLSKCASYYIMMENMVDVPCRFDVIGVVDKEIIHIENAFDFVT